MNKKLIAVAVAGVVAAPAAYADISAYGRVNNRIVIADNDDVNMQSSGSRFGFKGSGDMGNGMTAFARYEFGTNTDEVKDGSGISNRLSFVGLSGAFGSVSLGQQWSAYFQNFGTHASQNRVNGPYQIGPARTGNTIQYSNNFGPVSLKLDARVDDSDNGSRGFGNFRGNGVGGGVTITPMDNFTLAAAFDSSEGSGDVMDQDTMGLAAIAGFGGISVTVGHEQQDVGDDTENTSTILWLGAGVTDALSVKVGYGSYESDGPDGSSETDNLALIGAIKLGGGLQMWGEFTNIDSGDSDADTIVLGVQMDF